MQRVAREGGSAPIIEYPFVIGEDYNRLYFAQLLHHRPVLAGYYESGASWKDGFGLALDDSPERSEQPSRGYLLSDMTIDHVLGQGAPRRGIRFKTVVDVSDRALSERAKPSTCYSIGTWRENSCFSRW